MQSGTGGIWDRIWQKKKNIQKDWNSQMDQMGRNLGRKVYDELQGGNSGRRKGGLILLQAARRPKLKEAIQQYGQWPNNNIG